MFKWACSQNKLNLCKGVKNYYSDLQMNHLYNTEQYLVVGKVLSDLNTVLSEHYENLWHTRVEFMRGPGRNKLRTYKLL